MESVVNRLVKKLEKMLETKQVLPDSVKWLLKLRLCITSVALVHLIIVTVVILPTDMSGDADPRIRAFSRLKYRFITAWFNLIMLVYFPVYLYCDWRELKGDGRSGRVLLLRRLRDIVFTSVLFPVTMFADVLFWRLYLSDPELISPVALFDYMPRWGQHSLHTVSLVVMLLDLVLTPRTKPKDVSTRMALLMLFLLIYIFVVAVSYVNGDMVYQVLGTLHGVDLVVLCAFVYIECLFYFYLQFLLMDLLWNRQSSTKIPVNAR